MFNPPRTPTRNAKVERCQGTTGRWVDAASCADAEAFKANLAYAVTAQRERLKTRVCQGKTRAAYYPELFTNPNRFDANDFQWSRIYEHLAQGRWYRIVSSGGQSEMFGTTYQVGQMHKGTEVVVKFEVIVDRPYWAFYDHQSKLLRRCEAKNLIERSYFLVNQNVNEL